MTTNTGSPASMSLGTPRTWRSRTRLLAVITAAATAITLSACNSLGGKNYDIAPIFPLTKDKCAKYNGTAEGSGGLDEHCWVTQADCERAAADWRNAMHNMPDAIQFRC